jgi:hypothetical protein
MQRLIPMIVALVAGSGVATELRQLADKVIAIPVAELQRMLTVNPSVDSSNVG